MSHPAKILQWFLQRRTFSYITQIHQNQEIGIAHYHRLIYRPIQVLPTVPISPGKLEDRTQMTRCIKLPCLFSFLPSERVLKLAFSFMTLRLLKITGWLFSQISLNYKTLMESWRKITYSLTVSKMKIFNNFR